MASGLRAAGGRLLHQLVHGFQRLRRSVWFFTRPRTSGVHAIALTPERRIILVTLSYARGWRLPGGGRKAQEDPEAAIRRELAEEIGMTACGALRQVARFSHQEDYRQDRSSLFIAEDVRYRPRWSLEIKAVREFELAALPADAAPITLQLLAAAAADPVLAQPADSVEGSARKI